MKKIRLLFLTLVALVGGVVSSSGKTVYIQPNEAWWANNAQISLWIWSGNEDGAWADNPTVVEPGIIKFTFDDAIDKMVVVRGSDAQNWDAKIDQTANLQVQDGKLFKLYDCSGSLNGISTDCGIVVEDYTEPVPVGYTVDFNTSIAVPSNNHSDPMFQVSTGWTRIADRKDGDGYYGTAGYYMRYTYSSTAGVDGTGTLLANAQQAPQSSYDGTIETVNDYIVTPKVSGTVTLQVKGSTSASNSLPSFISFYAVDDDATTVGSEITATYSAELNTDNFVTATLTLTEATRIAIRAQWVYMDNFTATSAEIPEVKALTVTSVMNSDGQSGYTGTNPSFEQQPDGTLLVKLKVAIQNTGNVDIVAGTTENYTLTLASASSESAAKTYYEDAAITLTEDLAIGESTTIEVEATVNYTDSYGSYRYWFVRENVSGTTSSSYRYATSVAYEPKFIFRAAESTSTSSLSGTQAYGLITEETTKNFEIANTGTAPLIIKSITLPEGFTSANMPEIPAEGLSIAKGAIQELDITLPITTQGAISGTLTIVYLDKNSVEQTYTLAFSGNVLAAGTWAADFNVASSSETNYPAGSVAEAGIRFGTTYISADNYEGYLYSYTSSSYANENNKFITPKLHANAGDKLTFDVRRDDSSSSTYKLKVYVSTDRKTWGEPVYSVTAADLTSTFQTKEISFDAEGDYYVAFAIYGVRVDNLVGLTKVDVAHDLYIKSVSWPDASIKSSSAQTKPSVDIIPLTDETAEAYTVKYVCGETVLATGTPVALTASANTSKTFTFNWTPEVESTTTFENTKVVFDFGGGISFETETFTLTVTNEPKFHFVKTLPSSKWNEPSDYTTPITFGKTNTADTQTFYINNWGSAPLTVKSIALPVGFTTSVEAPLTVAAFNGENDGIAAASQALDITFSATEAREYSGEMVITYVNAAGEDATFTLAVSGTKLDPTKFYANFDDNSWPAGSTYQSNVSLVNKGTYSVPNYAINCTSTTNDMFVTPKLTAVAGDKLAFDAKLYNSTWADGKVVVYAAATRDEVLNAEEGTTRTQLFYASGSGDNNDQKDATITTDYQTFEVPALAGDYYYGFEIIGGPYVDELYGLSVTPVAHDLQIASSNIPAEAMQNVAATATVNILNLGLADEAAEDITVTAYVNGEAAGTGTAVALPMNHKLSDAGTQLSVSYLTSKVGTFPVYVEVKAGDYSVTTDPVDVVFAEEVAVAGVQVGTKTTTSSNVPFYTTWMDDDAGKSMADFIYTPEQLSACGITAGAKIKSITFVGTPGATKTINSLTTDVWVAQQAVSDFTAGSPDKDNMTHVNLHNAESVTFTSGSPYEFKINLTDPIVYDGTSGIRIYTNINGNGQYQSINFDVDGNYQNAYYAHGTGSFSTKVGNPVAFFGLETSVATLAGTVKTSAGAGIEGATVTLKADNGVQYSGTTAADGTYSINVIQAGLDFTATVEAEGYLKKEFALPNMNGASATQDVVLFKQFGLVGTMPGFNGWDNDMVMTQSTKDSNIFTLEMKNVNVTAGNYEFKLRADGAWDLADGFYKPNFDNGTDAGNGYTVSGGNYQWNFATSGTYNFLFTFDLSTSTLTFERPFLLAENADGVADLNWVDVTVEREFKAGWNAVVLPFALSADEVSVAFGENCELAVYKGDTNDNGNVTVNFESLTGKYKYMSAGYPYMLYLEEAVSGLKFTKNIVAEQTTAEGTTFDFVGVYKQTTNNDGDYIVQGGEFRKASTSNFVRPFRAYLKLKSGATARSINFVVSEGSEATAISAAEISGLEIEGAYNLNGQKVQNLNRKGLYIINGKKVMVK